MMWVTGWRQRLMFGCVQNRWKMTSTTSSRNTFPPILSSWCAYQRGLALSARDWRVFVMWLQKLSPSLIVTWRSTLTGMTSFWYLYYHLFIILVWCLLISYYLLLCILSICYIKDSSLVFSSLSSSLFCFFIFYCMYIPLFLHVYHYLCFPPCACLIWFSCLVAAATTTPAYAFTVVLSAYRLQPLLVEIVKDRRTVAMGHLDYILPDTFEYSFTPGYRTRYGFDWRLVFFETFFLKSQEKDKDVTDPLP